jgi:hypothetical protein
MTSHKITVRAIFNAAGEPIRFLHNGRFMDCEPSNDVSIDEFFTEFMPPQELKDQSQNL